MKPAVFRHKDGLQLSYNSPQLIYDAHVYPRQSANGSIVVVHGHDKGVRVVWYAGKKFKTSPPPAPKTNGTAKTDSMVIDLDDDDDEPQTVTTAAEFEEEEDEIDLSKPYRTILRQLDVPLGAAALHLAIPPSPADTSDLSPDTFPSLLHDQLVVAAACSDTSIRLISLPLLPPAPGIDDTSKLNVNVTKLYGRAFHQDLITGLAITYEHDQNALSEQDDSSTEEHIQKWSIVLASTSCTGSGLLLIHQIPISKSGHLSSQPVHSTAIQRVHLRCSLATVQLSFNPSPSPSRSHTNLLITLPDSGCVKIYQTVSTQAFMRNRRGSNATQDSISSSLSLQQHNPGHGKILTTLLTEYVNSDSSVVNNQRKNVLSAQWILSGRAIIALLESGEWGIWDLEAAGPTSTASNQNLVKGQGKIHGIQGGAWTRFAVKGVIHSNSTSAKQISTNQPSAPNNLAPATPHTRKVRAEGLFRGNLENLAGLSTDHVFGRVFVSTLITNKHDESVVLHYNGQSLFIHSVLTYWKSEVTGRGAFDASTSSKPVVLPAVRTSDEMINTLALLPSVPSQAEGEMFGTSSVKPNFLVATDTRLIFFVQPLTESTDGDDLGQNTSEPFPSVLDRDQSLLRQGELDVDGMDRILDGMNGENVRPNFSKSVGFHIPEDDDDNDVQMTGSPTPSARQQSKKNRLQLNKPNSAPRKLFT